MIKYFLICFVLAGLLVVAAALVRGVRTDLPPWEIFPDMDRQFKVRFQQPSSFFADGVAARLPVAGTVPMGYEIPGKPAARGGIAPGAFTHAADYYNTGRFGEFFGDGMPGEIAVGQELLARGRARFDINCAPCHGTAGNGMGAVSKYWATPITSLHDPRILDRAQTPDGALFFTITHGKGLMGPYGGNITVRDRWAIVAYVRSLQMSQSAGGVAQAE